MKTMGMLRSLTSLLAHRALGAILIALALAGGMLVGGCAFGAEARKDVPSFIDPGEFAGLRQGASAYPAAKALAPSAPPPALPAAHRGPGAATQPRKARDVVYSAAF